MRKLLCLLLCLTFLPILSVPAEGAVLAIDPPTETVRPGKALLLTFTVPADGLVDLTLVSSSGETLMTIVEDHSVTAGSQQLWWNGTSGGVTAPVGVHQLVLTQGEASASAEVTVGDQAPYITSIQPDKDAESMTLTVDFYASVDGLLSVGMWAGNVWTLLENRQVTAGMNQVTWDASAVKANTIALTLTLTDAAGYSSNEEHIPVTPADFGIVFATATPTATSTPTATPEPSTTPVVTATPAPTIVIVVEEAEPVSTATPTPVPTPEPTPNIIFTPSYGSPYETIEGEAPNYWNTPMDITDEEAVWAMLSAPITVVDVDLKSQTRIYAEPDEDSRTVGLVTGESQGVRVIEHLDNGWSLIECYSSTFHDNSIQAWNMLIQGYIQTNKLETKELNDKYHIVVDKLTQRLYLFGEGKLVSTLLISTGLANQEQPYNETRSGEFLYISPTGGFWSDEMFCPSALKFNDGDLLHEVPYIQRDRNTSNSKIYSATEPYLGQRASHGCIRVQRKKTPEGINMQWIWNNRKELGRIVIWVDWQGRQISYPADDTILYYNPKGGSYYHKGETCYSAKSSVVFSTFTYAELDSGDYAKLDYCPYCAPAMRKADIDKVNETHAFGGDHDPILTAARQKYLEKLLEDLSLDDLTAGELRYYVPAATE